MSDELPSEFGFEIFETRSSAVSQPAINSHNNFVRNVMADVTESQSKGSVTLSRLRQGLKGFGANNGHTAPKPTIQSLDIPGFNFSKVSATVSSVATTYELQRFFEKLHEEAGVTVEEDRHSLSAAFVTYISLNGCSARQDYKDGRMVFASKQGETSVPASIIPAALGKTELRRIGNALADVQRALLNANEEILTTVLNQVSGWAARPKYPDLVLETATHCSNLSVDERKFANLAKIRRLQFSENPNGFIKGKDAETMFDVNNVDTQARNRMSTFK